MKKNGIYLLMGLVSLAVVSLDVLLKNWVIENMALYEQRALIPGFLGLFHTRNTGAAFSLFSDASWVLAILSGLVLGAMLFVIIKKWFTHPLALLALASVFGGAAGNLTDRIRFGYVVDMFEFLFVRFAIFNPADIFIVTGGIALALYFIFVHKENKPAAEETRPPEDENHA